MNRHWPQTDTQHFLLTSCPFCPVIDSVHRGAHGVGVVGGIVVVGTEVVAGIVVVGTEVVVGTDVVLGTEVVGGVRVVRTIAGETFGFLSR